jgi:hypothetical protein
MAKLKKDELEKVVRRDMPGYRLARRAKPRPGLDRARSRPAASAATPDLDTLKRKYLPRQGANAAAAAAADAAVRGAGAGRPAAPDNDDEIVAVEPETAPHPWDRGARPKAVVVSARGKRIVGKQG